MAFLKMFVILCYILALSARFSSQEWNSHQDRSTQKIKYDFEKTRPTPVPENATINEVLFDLNSVRFGNQPAASFRFQVITTDDSIPSLPRLFTVDENRYLRFDQFSESDPSDFFDYEQYPTVVVSIQATSTSGRKDIKWLKVTIPLADVNDELPVLDNSPYPYFASLPEQAEAGYIVYILCAEDPDLDSKIVFSIDNTNVEEDVDRFFEIATVETNETKLVEGQIKLSHNAAFTTGRKFVIPVMVKDAKREYQRITVDVNVVVGPLEPQFYLKNYEGWIFETDHINRPVFSKANPHQRLVVEVKQFQDGPLSYKLMDENNQESTKFRIDGNGHIFNKNALDFDEPMTQKYRLRIKAIESSDRGNLESEAPIQITVRDENDNAPHFEQTQFQKQIPEDYEIGKSVLSVLAEDIDSGKNGEVTYEIDDPYFEVRKVGQDGVIFVKSKLDFDSPPGPTYRFKVVAKDKGVLSKSSSVDVMISTSNVNDESPVIAAPGVSRLRDDAPKNFIITRLKATDKDGDNVKFYFSPRSETHGIFRILPSSGVIKVISKVPDLISNYTLNITAVDDGSCCGGLKYQESSISFVVKVVDSVNQKPSFTDCLQYTERAYFEEEMEIGTPILKVGATDPDRGLNAEVNYFIESPSGADAPFDIDIRTGLITVKNKVDRESLAKDFIQVTVKGSDKAKVPQEGWCTFRVPVIDINDNAPTFNSPSYSERISSNTIVSKVILRVGATDKDIGNNAKLTYSLHGDDAKAFGIYEETGLIYVNQKLNDPTKREYNFVVKALDHGKPRKHGTVKVKIEVAVPTTEPPKFDDDVKGYNYKIEETVLPNTDKAVLTTLGCQSNTENPRVQYFIVDSKGELKSHQAGAFAIYEFHQNSRYLVNVSVAQALDYERQKEYSLTLRCQNFGAEPQYDQITINVKVEDRNNKLPYFEGMGKFGRYVGSVPENTPAGVTVIEVQGYDDDVSPAFNQLHFTLINDSYRPEFPGFVADDFEIKQLKGNKAAIITKHTFDREVRAFYYLNVRADDKSPSDHVAHKIPGTPNSRDVVVQVDIIDKNDNPMTFKQSRYNHTVKETASIGEVIFSVTADDIDEVDQGGLKYRFINSEEIPFDIRDQTGEIIVTGKLNYESEHKHYDLILESRDSDNIFSATTTVVISVIDENDNPPVFSQSEYVIDDRVVEEDHTITPDNPMTLIQVQATDSDLSRTTNMRYRLLGEGTEPGDKQLFTINPTTGVISLIAGLNRDEPSGKSEYIFTVEARDEDVDPQKGYTNIKVKPKDINDNPPIFNRDRLTGEVDEHSPPRWKAENRENYPPIAVVISHDYDYKENGTVTYEIVSSPTTSSENYFSIDRHGNIYSKVDAKYLDRELRPKLEVVVRARDQSVEPLTSTATVTIILRDINDNAPEFTQPVYDATMSENLKEGVVTEVHATDKDEYKNAELTFRIASGQGHFKIDSVENRGIISIYEAVDFEDLINPVFELDVEVRDSNESHVDRAKVRITILDFNDNYPRFTENIKESYIEENQAPGKSVAELKATDIDSGINAQFSYLIDHESDPRREFVIDPKSGVVKTRKKLDRELQAKMEILIKAVDEGDPRQTGTATLSVTVTDVNDNFPVFKEDYRPVVYENIEPGKNGIPSPLHVLEVFARDEDTDKFGGPFGFALPDDCDSVACQKFSLTFNPEKDHGDGTATITTQSVFDREEAKMYKLPIVMWDMRNKINSFNSNSGPMTGTNTLTIIIGDVNDNEHFSGHQEIFVYNYKGAKQFYETVNFVGQFGPLVIGRVFVQDADDWDLEDKTFTFVTPPSMRNFFVVDPDNGEITMKRGVPANYGDEPYIFSVDVYDFAFDKTVTSTVAITVKDLSEEAVFNSGGVRLQGMTAEKFIGGEEPSLYDNFRELLAKKLGYSSPENVEIVTLRNGDGYLEVRYSAHGSPYISPAQADSAVILNKDEFESLGITLLPLPIDECEDEIFEGGCYNKLTVTGKPLMVNANGTSYVGVEAYLVATEGCTADQLAEENTCTADYCFNGGTCLKDDWGTLSCQCHSGFEGSRCQQVRHSFDGSSVSMYPTLQQCLISQTSIQFMTDKPDGIILYNGPLTNIDPLVVRIINARKYIVFIKYFLLPPLKPVLILAITRKIEGKLSTVGQRSPQDFILLELLGGFPVLTIDHGTGQAVLTLDGKDMSGTQLMQALNDGAWHTIDINRDGKRVELVVDKCRAAQTENDFVHDDRACKVVRETPGENLFLNVNTYLQLGGIHSDVKMEDLKHLGTRRTGPFHHFKGCVKNLVHNKKLYDLHFRRILGLNSGENGCHAEDVHCLVPKVTASFKPTRPGTISGIIVDPPKVPLCGPHGTCEASLDGNPTCHCEPGWYGARCNKVASVRDFDKLSYYLWKMKDEFYNKLIKNRELSLQLMFRTRQRTGVFIYLYDHSTSTTSTHYVKLQLHEGKVRLSYNLGGGEKTLDLTHAQANNGQWHTLLMERFGREFHLKLDGGEGRNYNFTLGSQERYKSLSRVKAERDVLKVNNHVFFGAVKKGVGAYVTLRGDLVSTCVQDVRVNDHYFALTEEESKESDTYAEIVDNQNTREGCYRKDCKGNTCPKPKVCVPLWEDSECRCQAGYRLAGDVCVSSCNPNPCFNNVSCEIIYSRLVCHCPPGWRGVFCDTLAPEQVKSGDISDGALAAMIVSMISALMFVIAAFLLYKFCPRNEEGEKYILEVDPEDDIRENVINYDEEGAGEEDQSAYDLSRLQKASCEAPLLPKQRSYPLGNAPKRDSKVDVGNFIDDRMKDADGDEGAPPYDAVREYAFEGGDSDAGSLSSLNTSSSGDNDHEYDYLNDWGPKFSRLANMYGTGMEEES
ncbi:neural-cadherin [Plakobranchus ocellatus]|uniref:Neural-cadherin n=1 Tax=Plakobranchus ocellatus TaxID=259542 RepID=A0AAV3YVF1_9GAST|nr:neural-cadherin [Plakobranchus ocellatus]